MGWSAANHTLDVVVRGCHCSDRVGIIRLPGTGGSDPGKISSALPQDNDYNLLSSLESFKVRDLKESLPTIHLSRGLWVSGWTIILVYFLQVHGVISQRAACKDHGCQTIR